MTTESPSDAYEQWNTAIFRWLFNGRHANRPVYLHLESDEITEIQSTLEGEAGGDATKNFMQAVRGTLNLRDRGRYVFEPHFRRTLEWASDPASDSIPPFLGLLVFTSQAAALMRSDDHFRSSNYYARLCECLCLAVDEKNHLEASYRDHVTPIWGEYVNWLGLFNGTLGLPSTQSDYYARHVAFPLSQALVRASDRERLVDMFMAYHLVPGSTVSHSDMEELLRAWCTGSGGTPALSKLCTGGAITQLAEICLGELLTWDGAPRNIPKASGHNEIIPDTEILLAAQLTTQPSTKLSLYFCLSTAAPSSDSPYKLSDGASEFAKAAFDQGRAVMRIGNPLRQGLSLGHFDPEPHFPDALLTRFSFEDGDSQATWTPRSLKVLEFDGALRAYVEVPRVRIGSRYLVMSLQRSIDEIRAVLSVVARPGFAEHPTGAVAGVPTEWTLFSDVEIVDTCETTCIDAMPLVSLTRTTICLTRGFRLPESGTWLSACPPTYEVMGDRERASSIVLYGASLADPRRFEIPEAGSQCPFPSNAAGDYRLVLETGDSKPRASVPIRLRSGQLPRPETIALDDSNGLVDLCRDATSNDNNAHARNHGLNAHGHHGPLPPERIEIVARPASDESWSIYHAHAGEPPSCLSKGGGHHLILDDATRGGTAGRCKNCGAEEWIPRRAKGIKRGNAIIGRSIDSAVRAATQPTGLVENVAVNTPPGDVAELLDALSYLSIGSWTDFTGLARQVTDDVWGPAQLARELQAMNLVDFCHDSRTGAVSQWRVADTSVVEIPETGMGLVCGRRPLEFTEALKSVFGERLITTVTQHGVEKLIVRLDHHVRTCLDQCPTPNATPIRIDASLAKQLVASAQPIEYYATQFDEVNLPTRSEYLRKWRPLTDTWEQIEDLGREGLFRVEALPRRFAFSETSAERASHRACDGQVGKWIAGRRSGTPLMAYSQDSQILKCRIGTDLVGIYARMVVLNSGNVGLYGSDGSISYAGVSTMVAARLWASLGPKVAI
jgi:hypothetical protein